MKNNNDNETSKIRAIFNKLFGLNSNTKNVPDKAYAIAKAKREKEAKARREDETSNVNKESQLQSSPDLGDIHKILQKLNDLSDEFKILRAENEKKDEEIQRFREGYDSSKVKDFFSRFTFVDSVIKEYLDDNKIDIDGLKDIQIQMNEAFLEYGIESFSPEIGTEIHKLTDLVEEGFKKVSTNNKELDLTIAEVLKSGYRRKLPNSDFQVITKAKVRVFVFKQ
jgi:molecular chaperone GrpE (heat shock protein)